MEYSNAESVKEFTEGNGRKYPDKPVKMTKDEVFFIIRMVMSELDELAATVSSNMEESGKLMQEALNTIDKCKNFSYPDDISIISSQFDAMVDAWYYMLNTACKHGTNLSKIFNLVHAANMNKKDPLTKKFIVRESDGKILKPSGWVEPDINKEIERQMKDGAWNN